ncbi:alkylhydroperoxidase-related (seleno)protein [Candidatus Poriferisodalis sp.]|uniref:alkylhydroperoxidase-related (seleno)protein n=1 Tax=Candidatus Poriferisodalis sp. TaxID=3101277 RepID=UPI003B02B1A2
MSRTPASYTVAKNEDANSTDTSTVTAQRTSRRPYDTELPIRDDLQAAHGEIAARWSQPGTWWTAVQRTEIVAQVRAARDERDHRSNGDDPLPPWVQPSTLAQRAGQARPEPADANGLLPPAAVDAVWRITNHPGTLTQDWYRSIIGRGIDPLAYVELVGLVAQANCVDRFADALGLPRIALGEPVDGPPTQHTAPTPVEYQVKYHWVPTAELKMPNVIKALSAVPAENEALFILSDAQYVPMDRVRGELINDQNSLSRPQIELIAARTSKLNECFY